MSVVDSVDIPIEIFGGLVTQESPADLPHGVSPDCQDLQFQEGNCETRPGLTSLYTLPGNPTANYLKTYENLQLVPRFLSLDSLGVLRKDVAPGGILSVIAGDILPGTIAKSTTAFGREYIGIGNGLSGVDIPRQYDDTNLDRISQVGPGAAPGVQDEVVPLAITASPNGLLPLAPLAINAGPLGATEAGNIVTIKSNSGGFPVSFLRAGDSVVIAGVGVAGYNGTFPITSILPDLSGFTYYNPTAGLAASGGGTATSSIYEVLTTTPNNFGIGFPISLPVLPTVTVAGAGVAGYNGTWSVRASAISAVFVNIPGSFALGLSGNGTLTINGNIVAGPHQLTVIFVTRNGYFTKPAPPVTWTAAGGRRATVFNIPLGPPNVVARVLSFSAANGASFFHLGPTGLTRWSSNMYIPDNTTTTWTVDFTDDILLLGSLDDPLFRLIELPEVSGTIDYAERILAWGELNLVQGFNNLSFDGGFSNPGALPNFPLGWNLDVVSSPGGASAVAQGFPPYFGDAYEIIGNGVTPTRGKISQSAAANYLGNPILQPKTAYTVRIRAKVAGANAGVLHVNLFSSSTGIVLPGITLAFNQATASYAVYTANLTNGLAAIPADLVLQIYVDGTPNNGAVFSIKPIEIYPTAVPLNTSNIRASGTGNATNQTPESFDGITGLITISENNGQAVRTCFKLRERLYLVKEHSFFATQDDGVNEPDKWSLSQISSRIGTPSINGVGGSYSETAGEDWVVIAHRTGLYLFWGGEPVKICPEIQPTWDTINWKYGSTISVAVDTRKRRIFICAPFGNSTIPNETLVLDYHDVGGPDMLASMEPVKLSFQGKKIVSDKARKWCPWTVSANSIAQIEQADGTSQIYFGSNDGTGNINLLDDDAKTDNGAAIPSYYTTAAFPEESAEQALQLRSHRKLFTYMTLFAQGQGMLGVTAYPDSLSNAQALNPFALSDPAFNDLEMMLNISRERCFFKFNSSGVGQWFSLQRACISLKVEPWSQVRGA